MILLTGHNGFIGKNICNRDFDVPKYCVGQKNCFKIFDDTDLWNHVTEIWHIGAISDTTETNIEKIYKYNIDFTLKLFNKGIEYGVPVKFASSASVYGTTKDLINPLNYYAFSKAIIDRWIEDNMHKFVRIQSYRFFNVYGRFEDHKGNQASPIHTFTKQAKETGVIKLFENSHYYFRDFVWVEDVIDCMMVDRSSGIYDVGTSYPRSFEDVGHMIANKYNAKIEYIPFPKHLRGKYQENTCALRHFNHDFITVEEFLSRQS